MTPQKSKPKNQACAACRYQRRKCTPDCLFRPYFPHDHQQQYQNVHKLFGVSNITKIIKNLDDDRHKDDAMKSIIYQADARAQYPVEGCCMIIRQLHHQIETASAELQIVLRELALYQTLGVQKYNNQFDDTASSFFDNNASFDCDQVDFDDDVGCGDVLVQNDVTKYEPSEENVYDEENEKDVIKVEDVYYNEEEDEEEYDDDDDDDDGGDDDDDEEEDAADDDDDEKDDADDLDTFQDGKAI